MMFRSLHVLLHSTSNKMVTCCSGPRAQVTCSEPVEYGSKPVPLINNKKIQILRNNNINGSCGRYSLKCAKPNQLKTSASKWDNFCSGLCT